LTFHLTLFGQNVESTGGQEDDCGEDGAPVACEVFVELAIHNIGVLSKPVEELKSLNSVVSIGSKLVLSLKLIGVPGSKYNSVD